MSNFDKVMINNAIDAVLDEHVASTRSQRIALRDLILDAVESANIEIKAARTPKPPRDYAADVTDWPD